MKCPIEHVVDCRAAANRSLAHVIAFTRQPTVQQGNLSGHALGVGREIGHRRRQFASTAATTQLVDGDSEDVGEDHKLLDLNGPLTRLDLGDRRTMTEQTSAIDLPHQLALRPVARFTTFPNLMPESVADGLLCPHMESIDDFRTRHHMLENMPTKTTKTDVEKLPRKALHASETASAEAREQASEYGSVFAPTPLELDDGDVIMIPPHPDYALVDDDRLQAYDELMFEADTRYQRDPDIIVPEQHVKDADGNDTGVVMPSEIIRGALRRPYRILNGDGVPELVRPPHPVRVAKAVLGENDYKRLREGGRSAADVWKIWSEQTEKIRERGQKDSKSAAGPLRVEAVSEGDSQ